MSRFHWFPALALTCSTWLFGQGGPWGVPYGQCVVIEAIYQSPTEWKWTLVQGGVIQREFYATVFKIPDGNHLRLTDMKFTMRGSAGRSANVVLGVKQGIKKMEIFRLTLTLTAGLQQNVFSEHFTSPIMLAKNSELSAFISPANGGVGIESCLLYGYFMASAK